MNEFYTDLLVCDKQQPFGWKCIRAWHPNGTPCACVPRWYNWSRFARRYRRAAR